MLQAASLWGPAGRARAAAADAVAHRTGSDARPVTLFYGGKIHTQRGMEDPSGRAQLWMHHRDRPGFRILSSWDAVRLQPIPINTTFAEEMPNATFCYSPLGHDSGDSDRYIPAILFGCIPVMLASSNRGGTRVPLSQSMDEHPDIDWRSFSVLLEMEDIPRLHEILARITHAEVRRMRHALSRVWHRFLWTYIFGSYLGEDGGDDAFESMMGVLRWRLPNMGLATRAELAAQEAMQRREARRRRKKAEGR